MEYKGFDIDCEQIDINKFGYIVPAISETTVYKTESAAKCAITKYLKQQEQVEKSHDRVMNGDIECDSYEGSCYMDDEEYSNPLIKEFEKMLDEFGKEDNPTQQSRNKREGFFSGLYNGSVKRLPIDTYDNGAKYVWSSSDVPKNRKQRKAAKLKENNWNTGKAFADYLEATM